MYRELEIYDNYIWNIKLITKLLLRTVTSDSHTQHVIRITLFFFWIELTTISGKYAEICIGLYNLFSKFGMGMEGNFEKLK